MAQNGASMKCLYDPIWLFMTQNVPAWLQMALKHFSPKSFSFTGREVSMTESGRLICREEVKFKTDQLMWIWVPSLLEALPWLGPCGGWQTFCSCRSGVFSARRRRRGWGRAEWWARWSPPGWAQFLSHSIHPTGFQLLHQVYSLLVVIAQPEGVS